MKFKLDENVPVELREDLRTLGHDAETVPDEGLTGAPDRLVLERAREEDRVLLTLDKGIADVRRYPPEQYAGIILLRPSSAGRGAVLDFARRHLIGVLGFPLRGRLLVVGDRSMRIR